MVERTAVVQTEAVQTVVASEVAVGTLAVLDPC